MRAVRFDEYGGIDVLDVREVEDPAPAPGRAIVRVRATGLNAGEIAIREGYLHAIYPATFPSGEGTDLAGEVVSVADDGSPFDAGDAVLGWTDERAAHAELVSVPLEQLTAKPDALGWEPAGALFVASTAALASVRAVAPQAGETVVVSGAAGGVGSLAVQLARRTGARGARSCSCPEGAAMSAPRTSLGTFRHSGGFELCGPPPRRYPSPGRRSQ